MIIKLLITIVFIIISVLSEACEVKLPAHLMILGETSNFEMAVKNTNCSEQTLQDVYATINSVEGKITALQFSEILKSRNHSVTILPSLIQVQHLNHVVREQMNMPPGVLLRSSEAINLPNYIVLNPWDRVEIKCTGCLYGQQDVINVNITGETGLSKSINVKADFRKMVRAYRVRGFHPSFSEIMPSSLTEVFVESVPHTDLVTNLDTLKFHKINKPIRSGELLKQADLNALNLVKAGLITEVIIENKHLKIKTSGISRSNGTLGEIVEVFHPQKNKKYQGKVIDINKVLVEL